MKFPDIQGYTRVKSMFTGRTTYYRGGSGNPNMDGFLALFTADEAVGRLLSPIILTPFMAIFMATWGSNYWGSRGGVVCALLGVLIGVVGGYMLAHRFLRFLGWAIVLSVTTFSMYVVWTILVSFWYADDPTYPSARLVRENVMGDGIKCGDWGKGWNSSRSYISKEDRLETEHYICGQPDLISRELEVKGLIESLDKYDRKTRELIEDSLTFSRDDLYSCLHADNRDRCIREAYKDMTSGIRSRVVGR